MSKLMQALMQRANLPTFPTQAEQRRHAYRDTAYYHDRLHSPLFMQELVRRAPYAEHTQPHWVGTPNHGGYIVGGLSDAHFIEE